MPDMNAGEMKMKNEGCPLKISLQAIPSKLQVTGGREIAFTRAVLSIVNDGPTALAGFIPHATFAQERGIVHDATEVLSRSKIVEAMQPGEQVTWDVYDLVLIAHPGVASKVHLWGHKAVLDWWLDFVAWAEYRTPDVAALQQTPKHRWRLRWSPAKAKADEIILEVAED